MKRRSILFIAILVISGLLIGGNKKGKVEAALAYLKVIESEINTSVAGWRYSTDGCSWKEYTPGGLIRGEDAYLKADVELKRIFAGVSVEKAPVFLRLKIKTRGLLEVNIYLDRDKKSSFKIDASNGTEKIETINVKILDSNSPGVHQLEITMKNKGFSPSRGEFWPPRSTPLPEEGIYEAILEPEILYEGTEGNLENIKDWISSMKVAYYLLNPVLVRRTFTGKPYRIKDQRKVPRSKIEKLNQKWANAVMAFDLSALRKGNSKALFQSISLSYKISGDLGKYARGFKIFIVGNSHIDVAWLWRIYETMHVARNTFYSVIKNMSEYPELHYAQSSAIMYEWMEKYFPEVFDAIKKKVKEGKWEIVGGMWLEPDCNLISGESWVRQILYGKRYFREKFGIDVKVGWNIDSFGYNWNMPQIYRKSGIDYFVTQKIWWNDTTVFPYYIFWWEGVDGTRILSYFPPVGYTSRLQLERTVKAVSTYEATTGYKKSLILFGLGDHGGGPNREILSRVRHYSLLKIRPEFIHSNSIDFLKNVEKDLGKNIPVWKDELYLEYHRGTYTTHSKIKKNNRKSEIMLSKTEKLASISHILGANYPSSKLLKAWKLVMTNQFHDILPGSGITPIYRDAMEFYRKAQMILKKIEKNSINYLASKVNTDVKGIPIIVFNPLSWERTDYVKIKLPQELGDKSIVVKDPDGKVVPSETFKTEKGVFLGFIANKVPSLGYKVYSLSEGKIEVPDTDLRAEKYTLENSYYRVVIDPQSGNIKSLYDKKLKKEFIAPGREGNVLQIYEDRPERWDAWNIGYTGRMWEINRADSVKLVHFSPVRAVIRVKKSFLGLSKDRYSPTEDFPSSFFIQDITLYSGIDRLDIKMKADWWETHMFLKVAFPVSVKSDKAAYEIPFATIERTTKLDTLWEKARFEVPAHKWADLSDGNAGISLLNDSKYGYDIHANVMKLSLLRSPVWPDPTADRGKHSFTYSIYTHAGKWNSSGTIQRAYELNTPLVTFVTKKHPGNLPLVYSFFSVDSSQVVLDTIKKAEDDDAIILRLYEAYGRPANVTLRVFRKPLMVKETNLMEESPADVTFKGSEIKLKFKKFEIKTLKLKF